MNNVTAYKAHSKPIKQTKYTNKLDVVGGWGMWKLCERRFWQSWAFPWWSCPPDSPIYLSDDGHDGVDVSDARKRLSLSLKTSLEMRMSRTARMAHPLPVPPPMRSWWVKGRRVRVLLTADAHPCYRLFPPLVFKSYQFSEWAFLCGMPLSFLSAQ